MEGGRRCGCEYILSGSSLRLMCLVLVGKPSSLVEQRLDLRRSLIGPNTTSAEEVIRSSIYLCNLFARSFACYQIILSTRQTRVETSQVSTASTATMHFLSTALNFLCLTTSLQVLAAPLTFTDIERRWSAGESDVRIEPQHTKGAILPCPLITDQHI